MKAKQVFNNAKWIIICKVIQSVMQLIIGMLCARYLGPSNYGLINYAASIIAFATPVMRLGLNSTLVHEYVKRPEKEGQIAGTSIVLNMISGLACIVGVTAFAAVANFNDIEAIIVCALYSLSLFFTALEMIQYWFQYKLMSKYSSIVMLVSYFVVSVYKIFLLATNKGVYWFAVSHAVEYGVIAIILLIIYRRKGTQKFSFSKDLAKKLLHSSKHYILADLMVIVVQHTDHIMITNMIGKADNGFYSAAITTVGVVQFVYYAIIDSYRPIIFSSKKESKEKYQKTISSLYSIIMYLCFAQSIFFTVFAKLIINVLYGAEYTSSVVLLQVLVWYIAFSFMGTVRNVWLLAEEKQKYLWRINMSGAALNVVLNIIMIPYIGALGAAIASLITQIFANFILGFIIKPLRENNALLIKGLSPVFFVKELKTITKLLRKNSK